LIKKILAKKMKINNIFKKYLLIDSNINKKETSESQINRITLKPNFGHRKKITILNKDVE